MSAPAYPDLDWLLSLNPRFRPEFQRHWAWNDEFQLYVDSLLHRLLSRGATGLEGKIRDTNTLEKFDALFGELRVADVLSANGNKVELLPDSFMGDKRSPDMLVRGSPRDALVEVRALLEDEVEGMILKNLRALLATTDYWVSVQLSSDIARHELDLRAQAAERMMEVFRREFDPSNPSRQPVISTEYGTFRLFKKPESGERGGVATGGPIINVPSAWLQDRLTKAIAEKAGKRTEWDAEHKAYAYIVALVSGDTWLDEVHVEAALIGARAFHEEFLPPQDEVVRRIRLAEERGWRETLRGRGITQGGQIVIDGRDIGAFFTDPVCSNVTGVLSLFANWRYMILGNPSAFTEIYEKDIDRYVLPDV